MLENNITYFYAYQSLKIALIPIYGEREATNISRLVMEHILKLSPIQWITEQRELLSNKQLVQYQGIKEKLLQQIPIQYIVGETHFMNLRMIVNDAVLIPRVETEELVQQVIQAVQSDVFVNIIDIGTGSGCMAIALKKVFPNSTVYGIDISKEALAVAQKNAHIHQVSIHWLQVDILDIDWQSIPAVDIIISNPPYIPLAEKETLMNHVKDKEPSIALFVPTQQPLLFYESILRFAHKKLKEGGAIYVEVHENFANEVVQLFVSSGYQAMCKKDMQHKDRMVCAQYKKKVY